MTRSTGTSGLIFAGSPPSSSIASRIAARSTTPGTPVKSCISTRAGWNGISSLGSAVGVPGGDRLDVGGGDRVAVLEAQRVLEQDLERVGQPGDVEAAPAARRGGRSRTRGRETSRVDRAPKESLAHPVLLPLRSSPRRDGQRLSVCPAAISSATFGRRRRRRPARRAPGRRCATMRRERPLAQRRDRDLGAVALDRPDDRRPPTCSRRRRCPGRGGALGAGVGEHPRVADRTRARRARRRRRCRRRSARRPRAKPRRPNLVAQ